MCAKVIANDGKATNVYGAYEAGIINVTSTSDIATILTPVVNSTTHPDPNKWYPQRTVGFTWGGGQGDYNYVFDQSPTTIPTPLSKGSNTATVVSNVGDGVWYFHVRAGSGVTWGPTATFKVQIDGTAPPPFTLQLTPAEKSSIFPIVEFNTVDSPSGVDKYELQVDDGLFVPASSPYQIGGVGAGDHALHVRATDKAGNQTATEGKFSLIALGPTPKILFPTSDFTYGLGQEQQIRGTGPTGATIQLFADDRYVTSVKADDKGNYTFKLNGELSVGSYKLYVKAIKDRNLDSSVSTVVSAKVVASSSNNPFNLPFNIFTAGYILVVLALLGVLLYLGWRFRRSHRNEQLARQKLELLSEPDPTGSGSPLEPANPLAAITPAPIVAQPVPLPLVAPIVVPVPTPATLSQQGAAAPVPAPTTSDPTKVVG